MRVESYGAQVLNKLPTFGIGQSLKRPLCVSSHFSHTRPTLPSSFRCSSAEKASGFGINPRFPRPDEQGFLSRPAEQPFYQIARGRAEIWSRSAQVDRSL